MLVSDSERYVSGEKNSPGKKRQYRTLPTHASKIEEDDPCKCWESNAENREYMNLGSGEVGLQDSTFQVGLRDCVQGIIETEARQ